MKRNDQDDFAPQRREGRDENYLCTANTQIARTMHAFFEQEITERTERRVVSASVDSVCSCSKSVCLVAAEGRVALLASLRCLLGSACAVLWIRWPQTAIMKGIAAA